MAERDELGVVLAALTSSTRRKIYRQIRESGETACRHVGTGVTKSTVAHHIKELRFAGLIEERVVGREKLLSATDDRFPKIVEAVLDE